MHQDQHICEGCKIHEHSHLKYRSKYQSLLKLVKDVRETLADAYEFDTNIDPNLLTDFIDKRLSEMGEQIK